ncbi:GapA-binding peptide SR1P [Bacillus sp. Marseille-P3661]|nr:GapA-binding peptide SR1P [Bacillus sp. Marseille-P3661]
MGIIVCQQCESTIEHFEDHKVTTLYAKCSDCCDHQEKTNE